MKFEDVLKSAPTREALVECVRKKAIERATESGGSFEKELAKIWRDHPAIYDLHESLAKAEPQPFQPKMANLTAAEVELDRRARKLMKGDAAMTYPRACSVALQDDPSLYEKYQRELAAGNTRPAVEYGGDPGMFGKADDGDEACDGCGQGVDSTDSFCRNCGDPIGRPTSKTKSKRK